jgi:hypothetical protein
MKINANQIFKSSKDALEKTREIKPDALGTKYHTFRIALSDDMESGNSIISEIASTGWHLMGGPVLIAAENEQPRHILFSMLTSDSRPLEIRHRIRMHGEIRGEFQGDGEGIIHSI